MFSIFKIKYEIWHSLQAAFNIYFYRKSCDCHLSINDSGSIFLDPRCRFTIFNLCTWTHKPILMSNILYWCPSLHTSCQNNELTKSHLCTDPSCSLQRWQPFFYPIIFLDLTLYFKYDCVSINSILVWIVFS